MLIGPNVNARDVVRINDHAIATADVRFIVEVTDSLVLMHAVLAGPQIW